MKVIAGIIMAASLLGAADRDMQRAIAWEHHKDQAAARQARLERRHPSVTYDANRADRSSDQEYAGPPGERPRSGRRAQIGGIYRPAYVSAISGK